MINKKQMIYASFALVFILFAVKVKTLFKKTPKVPYPTSTRSAELKVVSNKLVEKRRILVINQTKKTPLYVSVDCNYRTPEGGGYERKSNPRKVWVGRADTFFVYAPKGEKIAIRWTEETPERSAKEMTKEEAAKFDAQKKESEAEKAKLKEQKTAPTSTKKQKWYQKFVPKKTWFERKKKTTDKEKLAGALSRVRKDLRKKDWYETGYLSHPNIKVYIRENGEYYFKPGGPVYKANMLKFVPGKMLAKKTAKS